MENKPLIKKISEYLNGDFIGFHTPGHQKGKAVSVGFKELIGDKFLKADLTELPGLDNLRNPLACIENAQGLTARLFGACKTFFLVNGTTVGIHAALISLNKKRKKILIQRNAHVSILNGFVLSGGKPLIAPVVIDKNWGIPLGINKAEIENLMNNNLDIEGTILTHPSYQGVGLDVGQLNTLIRRNRVALAVDEAHGAHLYFQDRIPMSFQRVKADIVVQSTHKTLGALTQASMLHVNNEKWIESVNSALDVLHTTSPSYLLMASLDDVQGSMSENGTKLVDKLWEMCSYLVDSIRQIPFYRIFSDEIPSSWLHDLSKIVISAAELGITGWELADILEKKYGIYVEQSCYMYVLFLVTIGHTYEDINKLIFALKDICKDCRKQHILHNKMPYSPYSITPVLEKTPRETFYWEKEKVVLAEGRGRIAGSALSVYPPGVPLVWPGQIITCEHIDYIKWSLGNNLPVHGLDCEGKISVLK